MGAQFWVQLVGVVVTALWAGVATYIIVKLTKAICGLRVSEEDVIEGLDFTAHGEQGYNP